MCFVINAFGINGCNNLYISAHVYLTIVMNKHGKSIHVFILISFIITNACKVSENITSVSLKSFAMYVLMQRSLYGWIPSLPWGGKRLKQPPLTVTCVQLIKENILHGSVSFTPSVTSCLPVSMLPVSLSSPGNGSVQDTETRIPTCLTLTVY
jgi:hypothetical protein